MDRSVLVIICWIVATSSLILHVNRLSNLDSFWDTWVYRQQQKGIDPASMKRSEVWDNKIRASSIGGIFLGLFFYILPFLINT